MDHIVERDQFHVIYPQSLSLRSNCDFSHINNRLFELIRFNLDFFKEIPPSSRLLNNDTTQQYQNVCKYVCMRTFLLKST